MSMRAMVRSGAMLVLRPGFAAGDVAIFVTVFAVNTHGAVMGSGGSRRLVVDSAILQLAYHRLAVRGEIRQDTNGRYEPGHRRQTEAKHQAPKVAEAPDSIKAVQAPVKLS